MGGGGGGVYEYLTGCVYIMNDGWDGMGWSGMISGRRIVFCSLAGVLVWGLSLHVDGK